MDCSCAPILQFFSMASDGATTERQIYNRVFCQFRTSFRNDSVVNYAFSKSTTAGMHCPAGDDAFVSSFILKSDRANQIRNAEISLKINQQ